MKKKSLFLISTFIILFISFIKSKAQNNNGLLFEISGNGLSKPSYIFGSLPLSSNYKYTIDESILKHIDDCELVLSEIDFVKGTRVIADSAGISYYCFKLLAGLFNQNYNNVYLPSFATNINAEKSLFSIIGAGGSMLLQTERQLMSQYGLNVNLDKLQWPTYKIMQYAIKKNKSYMGLQDIDSLAFYYLDYMIKNEKSFGEITKAFGNITEAQKKNILTLLPQYIASGKSESLFELIKHLKNGIDTVLLNIINLRTNYLSLKIQKIIKSQSAFIAVNLPTLTNNNGVLEQLRKMGYKIKTVKMKQKSEVVYSAINSLPYEIKYHPVKCSDGLIDFVFPGEGREIQIGPFLTSWFHYDIVNKSSYIVSRIKHNYSFKGKSIEYIRKKADSLLYELVPGTIEKKVPLENPFYSGYDIVSINRNDDYLRLRFYITPYEFILIKCEGEKRFALQPQADGYFDHFALHANLLSPEKGDTLIQTGSYNTLLPKPVFGYSTPNHYFNYLESNIPEKNSGLIIIKGSYANISFLDEDTFLMNSCLSMFADHLKLKEISRVSGINNITGKFMDEENRYYTVKVIKSGINFFIAAGSYNAGNENDISKYLESFKPVTEIQYASFFAYKDTALHFEVNTITVPKEEPASRLENLIRKVSDLKKTSHQQESSKTHTFTSIESGENIIVDYSLYSEYSFFPDSAGFWKSVLDNAGVDYEYKISRKKVESVNGSHTLSFLLTDTNTRMGIKYKVILKGMVFFTLRASIDTIIGESKFIQTFFNTFMPARDTIFNGSLFEPLTDKYLEALISKDSTEAANALNIFPLYPFDKRHIPKLKDMLQNIPVKNEDDVEEKIKYRIMDIASSIKDSAATDFLKEWYVMAGDTVETQMRLLSSLARQKTVYSINTIKEYLTNNPPPAKNSNQLNYLFSTLEDTPRLASTIVAELMPLTGNDDFKEDFLSFIAYLADSGYLDPKVYSDKIPEFLLQAKNEFKRQNNMEEGEAGISSTYLLVNYIKLLIPFYNTNPDIKLFIDKSVQSNYLNLREDIAYFLLKHNINIHDSIWESLAKNDIYRYSLIQDLSRLKRLEKIPPAYSTQESYARSIICNDIIYGSEKNKFKAEDLIFLSKRKVYFHQQWGWVYLFKIKSKTYDYESSGDKQEWKLCMSGMQPVDSTKALLKRNLNYSSYESLKEGQSVEEQFDNLLNKVINDRRHTMYFAPSGNYDDSETGYNEETYD